MKFATYNSLGGLKGNTLYSLLKSHYLLYIKKSPREIKKFLGHVSKELEPIKKLKPDVVAINEVLEFRKNELRTFLEKEGFNCITESVSSLERGKLNFYTLLASKHLAEPIEIKITKGNKITNEGCACALKLKSTKKTIIAVHLSLSKKFRRKQLSEIEDFVKSQKSIGREIILMGDFNDPLKKIEKYFNLRKLGLKGIGKPTFPSIKIPSWLKRDYDHIFYPKEKKIKNVEVRGYDSDHLMLACSIE